jgi:hypothetical protein
MNPRFETWQYQFWDHIFGTLRVMREESVRCAKLFKYVRGKQIPEDVQLAVNQLTDAVKELYKYRDSFMIFSKDLGRKSQVDKWGALEGAKQALSVLQATYISKNKTISEYLRSLY